MDILPSYTLRIIDANLNRIGEGLRVLEEFARLTLNDAGLSQQLKNLRHDIVNIDADLQEQLIGARDSEGDVGADMAAEGDDKQRDAAGIIAANSRRVQESLRVMEEIAKSSVLNLDSDKYKKARFTVYTIEKALLSRMLRQDKAGEIKGLYVIMDTVFLKGRSYAKATEAVIKGGARLVQLRDKERNKEELLEIAGRMKKICNHFNVPFIMNDNLDIALAVDADGLHVGQDDLPVPTARQLLPVGKILGCSVRTVEEAQKAQSDGADYIGVGAMYSTSTKESAEVVGPERVKEIKQAVDLPIVAIGGINSKNLAEVLAAGAVSAAVISTVLGAADIEEATRRLVKIYEGQNAGKPGVDNRTPAKNTHRQR
jgi:thiamine-phosphate pyrophosphorylase